MLVVAAPLSVLRNVNRLQTGSMTAGMCFLTIKCNKLCRNDDESRLVMNKPLHLTHVQDAATHTISTKGRRRKLEGGGEGGDTHGA